MELGFPLERALWNTGSERTASVRWVPPLRQASGRQELGASGSIGKACWEDGRILICCEAGRFLVRAWVCGRDTTVTGYSLARWTQPR